MDSTIRTYLAKAEQENSKEYLDEAYSKLKGGRTKTSDQTDPFQSDLYVICAEVALKLQEIDTVNNCIKLFFQKTPPTNQFLCRAYMCQAQVNAPTSINEKEKLQLCIGYLMKAINFAKTSSRYFFLVYNASVLYWSFVRPFMRPNFRHHLTKSFHLVVKALDETNDPDFEWRAQLMIAVMECHIDSGRRDDALHVGLAAMNFMKSNVPQKYKEVFQLQLQHKLLEPAKIQSMIKGQPELSLAYKMHKIKTQASENLTAIQLNELERIFKSIIDGEEIGESRTGSSSSRPSLPLSYAERNSLLLDFTRLCISINQIEIAGKCITKLMALSNVDEKFSCEIGFMRCQFMVDSLKDKKENYTKISIETRIRAVENLSEHLMTAYRMNSRELVQVGCVTLWNLCLPLLQNNLRCKIHKPLLLAVELLEEIDSLLVLLRCQIHTEVAKCEEQVNQLQSAITHLLKASELDDSGSYKTRLSNFMKRIKLKALLYQVPERPEDHAAMIIEQADSGSNDCNPSKMQGYLAKAGSLLAPDSFMLAIEGEAEFSANNTSQCTVEMLAKRVKAYKNGMAKIVGHLKRLEGRDKSERIRLWSDLVKVARKQNVWDVTRVAARFCLLYEEVRSSTLLSAPDPVPSKANTYDGKTGNAITVPIMTNGNADAGVISKEELKGMLPFSDNDDATRIFAEINFIYGESLVQLLHKEGIKLLDKAIAPKDTKLRPKKYQDNPVKINEMDEWKSYSEWIDQISQESIERFYSAGNHGNSLGDAIIVCNAAIYTWNYTKHLLERGDFPHLTQFYQPLFNSIRRTGHGTETIFLCDLTNALAEGYMKPHIPNTYFNPPPKVMTPINLTPVPNQGRRKSGKPSQQNVVPKNRAGASSALNSDSLADLQQAAEILEYTLGVTSGADAKNMVPIAVRHKLIKAQVMCKSLLNQSLPKNLGHENESLESQGPMCKALFSLEALTLKQGRMAEFSNCPSIKDVIQRTENAKWTDDLLQLQVWSRLASLAFENSDYTTSISCCDSALKLEQKSKSVKYHKQNEKTKHKFTVEQELLHYVSVIKGQCLIATMNGRNEIKRTGLNCFVEACRYASECDSYDLVLTAVRYYWNNICDAISTPIERQLLKEPIRTLLTYITKVSKDIFDEPTEERPTTEKQRRTTTSKSKSTYWESAQRSRTGSNKSTNQKSAEQSRGVDTKKALDEDLHLRAALYGVLFHTYADKGEYESGLVAMDEAINVMPRTHHRLVLFKHRVITNAKLGKPIQFDMQKFRDENESILAQMWYRVAKHSKKKSLQLCCFANAIESLTEEENIYQKIDYLAEFGEWLLVNEYPISKAKDQVKFAVYLALNSMSGNNMPKDGGQYMTGEEEIKILDQVTNLKQMNVLIHLYVILGEMEQSKDGKYREYILAAATLVQRIWKISMANAEKCITSGVHPGDTTPSKSHPVKKTQSKGRPSSKNSASLPSNIEDWVLFKVPEKIKEYFSSDIAGTFISNISIEKPMLSMYYYKKLCDNLYEVGFHHLAAPILALMSYLANDILRVTSLSTLVNLDLADLCDKLNLVDAFNHYQNTLANLKLSIEEQTESREEVEAWEEKQRQVSLEENRQGNILKPLHSWDSVQQNKPIIEGFTKRKIWVQIAESLIELYKFEVARTFLEEANISAIAFDDVDTKDQIAYNTALISFHLRDWGKVIATLSNVKWGKDSQLFWLKKTLLLVDALHNFSKQNNSFQSHFDDTGFEKAKKVLQNAIKTIEEACEKRKNGAYLGPYIKAKLLSRLGLIVYTESMERRHRSLKVHKKLLTDACRYLQESFDLFNELGYKKDSIEMGFLHVDIQRQLALLHNDLDAKKSSLMQTLKMAQTSVHHVSSVAAEITALTTHHEMGNIFLPIQNEIIIARKYCIEILCEILTIASEEKKNHRLKEEAKAPMERLIDEYVDIGSNLTPLQQQWQDTISTASEELMMMVASTKSLSASVPQLSADASLNIGKAMKLLSYFNCAGRYDSWNSKHHIITKSVNNADPEVTGSMTQMENTKKSLERRLEYESFASFQLQSAHNLTQALQLGLQHSLINIVRDASCHLLHSIGNMDPETCVNILALYQSAHTSIRCQNLVERGLIDPNTSASASLFKQKLFIQQKSLCKSHVDSVYSCLSQFEWWKRLSISKGHFDLIREIPFNVTFVILQHSPSKDYLFGGVLDKGSGGTSGKKKCVSRTMIGRVSTNPRVLSDMLDMLSDFRSLVRNEFMRQIYVGIQRQQRAGLLGADVQIGEVEVQQSELELEKSEFEKMKEMFDSIMLALEAYMTPLLDKIHHALKIDPIPQTVVILADEDMMELPLECLSIFKKIDIASITRDFSLQFFYHRFRRGETESGGTQSKMDHKSQPQKSKQDKVNKGEKASAVGKNAKSSDKKLTKEFVVDKENIQLDLSNLKYILDPLRDSEKVPEHPESVLDELNLQYKAKVAKWSGIKGSEEVSNVKEMQTVLQTSPALLFCGFERMLATLPAFSVVPLDLSDCILTILLDLVHTGTSSSRQGTIDALKSPRDLQLESPVNTAMILSLCGVSTIALNQWYTKLANNKHRMKEILTGLLDGSQNLGQCVRLLHGITKCQPESIQEEVEKSKDGGGSKDNKGGKKRNSNSVNSKRPRAESSAKTARGESKNNTRAESVLSSISGKGESETEDSEQNMKLCHENFNLVVYGLPNLAIC